MRGPAHAMQGCEETEIAASGPRRSGRGWWTGAGQRGGQRAVVWCRDCAQEVQVRTTARGLGREAERLAGEQAGRRRRPAQVGWSSRGLEENRVGSGPLRSKQSKTAGHAEGIRAQLQRHSGAWCAAARRGMPELTCWPACSAAARREQQGREERGGTVRQAFQVGWGEG